MNDTTQAIAALWIMLAAHTSGDMDDHDHAQNLLSPGASALFYELFEAHF